MTLITTLIMTLIPILARDALSQKKKQQERELGSHRTEHGALEHAAKEHDRKVKHRDELLAQFAQAADMPGYVGFAALHYSPSYYLMLTMHTWNDVCFFKDFTRFAIHSWILF